MGYIETKANPERKNYAKANITAQKAIELAEKGVFRKFAYCEGLWNNYIAPCDLDKLKSVVSWMCHGTVYISLDGQTLFIHGYSEADMF